MLLKFYCSRVLHTIITRMLWELKEALYNYRLNLSMDVFRKMFSNCITQPFLLMLPLLSVPGFLGHITLCVTGYFWL